MFGVSSLLKETRPDENHPMTWSRAVKSSCAHHCPRWFYITLVKDPWCMVGAHVQASVCSRDIVLDPVIPKSLEQQQQQLGSRLLSVQSNEIPAREEAIITQRHRVGIPTGHAPACDMTVKISLLKKALRCIRKQKQVSCEVN